MTDRMLIRSALLLACLPACYSGLDSFHRDPGAGSGVDQDDEGTDGAGDGAGPGQAQCLDGAVGRQPLRRLTRSQYNHAVRDLLGLDVDAAAAFPADEKIGPFRSNAVAPVSSLQVEQYMDAAESLAEAAVEEIEQILPCQPDVMGEEACADEFVEVFGRRALRRPLEAAEREIFRGIYEQGVEDSGFEEGIRMVVQAMLQSPYFLYHVELGQVEFGEGESADEADEGDELIPLTSYELASRLSFFLWDSIPDQALLDLAASSALSDPEALREQAGRMLDDPRAREAVGSFHLQWLGLDDLELLEKDPERFPQFDEQLVAAMQRETVDFTNWVVFEGDGRLETLLTSPTSIIDGPLFELYGVERPAGHTAGDLVELPPEQRAGILTHASLLAKNAHVDQSSPVHRGVTVRENFLCQILPTPPPDVDDVPPDPSPDATTRERFAEHTKNPECAGCHQLIDGIGFGFESYDAIGAFRTFEGDLPVDASGELLGAGDADGPFDGAIELAHRLAGSEDVQRCVSQQWMNFALGRVPGVDDACSIDLTHEAFVAAGYDVRELLLAIVSSDAFRFLERPEP